MPKNVQGNKRFHVSSSHVREHNIQLKGSKIRMILLVTNKHQIKRALMATDKVTAFYTFLQVEEVFEKGSYVTCEAPRNKPISVLSNSSIAMAHFSPFPPQPHLFPWNRSVLGTCRNNSGVLQFPLKPVTM